MKKIIFSLLGIGLFYSCQRSHGTEVGYRLDVEISEIQQEIHRVSEAVTDAPNDARFSAVLQQIQVWEFDTSEIAKRVCGDSLVWDSLEQISEREGVRLLAWRDRDRCIVRDVPDFFSLPEKTKAILNQLDAGYFTLVLKTQGVASSSNACQLIEEWEKFGKHQNTIVRQITNSEWRDWLIHLFGEGQKFADFNCIFAPDSAKNRVERRSFKTVQENIREIW
jgi:hypothetical protein